MNNNRKLGKGLSALIPNRVNDFYQKQENNKIDLLNIHPGKFQSRTVFEDVKLKELSESIKSNGVIQPILVRKNTTLSGYEIIAGERRWRASKMADLKEIPAMVLEINDKKAMEVAIIENIQRDNLTIIEEAEGYKNLIDEFCYTQEDLAKIIGKSRSHISNCIRVLSLPTEIKELTRQGLLSMGHARSLIGVKNAIDIANQVVKKSLSVRQVEELVKKCNKEKSIINKNPDIVLLEKNISKKLGLAVKINDSKGNSTVVIKFNTLDDLDCILKKLSKS